MRNYLPFALGKTPCDLVIRNVTYLDVFSATWKLGDVAIARGKVVALDFGLQAIREIDGRGKWLVPGFVDAHVHVESSLVTPRGFEKSVLPKGTTTAICDPHELTNVLGVRGLQYFLEEANHLDLNLQVMLSSCVPATHLETNGGNYLEDWYRCEIGHEGFFDELKRSGNSCCLTCLDNRHAKVKVA